MKFGVRCADRSPRCSEQHLSVRERTGSEIARKNRDGATKESCEAGGSSHSPGRRGAVMSYDNIVLGGLTAVALMVGTASGHAQSDDKRPARAAAETATSAEGETLKERLSDKASDEQRIDNCKVRSEEHTSE